MLSLSLQTGFFHAHGILGFVLSLAAMVILIWGAWKILDILTAKVPDDFKWLLQIVRIVLVVVVCLWFINMMFGFSWFN